MKKFLIFVLGLVCIFWLAAPSAAWWTGGHKLSTAAAVARLPAEMPAFFREAAEELAEMTAEPDNWKHPTAPHLKAAEQPEHYIDLEYLDGAPIPPLRADLLKLYQEKKVEPAKGGFLPCALLEGCERLMLAFREHRNRPDSKAARQRVILYAGWLAHYAQDSAMPLHTTKFYDGKPGADGQVQQKGIHARIDAYPERHGLTAEQLGKDQAAEHAVNVWPVIVKAIQAAHQHIKRCYELDAAGAFDKEPEKGRELMLERARAGVKLTLDLWYSAWMNSDPARATLKQQ